MAIKVSGTTVIDDSRNIQNVGVVTATNFVGNLTGTASTASASATAYGLTGSISGSNLTNLNASNLSTGTVPDARFPATLPTTSGANLTSLNASNLSTGTVPDARFPATLPTTSGANLTSLNASNLSSGTVPSARLGSGTASSSTFLKGDQTWGQVNAGYNVTTTSINKTLVADELTVALSSGLTITLPASPATNTQVAVGVGNFTNTIIARNGSNIMSLAEDMTIDVANRTVNLVFIDATRGWRIV
jgi:hypothetical protein